MGKPVIESHRGDSVFRRDRTGKVLAYRGGAAGDAAAANSSNARATGRGREQFLLMNENENKHEMKNVAKRGAFILFEGIDRCGKTTQSKMLTENLLKRGIKVEHMRFPDRATQIGKMINSYLTNTVDTDDKAIHLLFAANRWEKMKIMREKLESGVSLIVDRYSYSGVAFTASKGYGVQWCYQPEIGMISPDLVIWLDMPLEDVKTRGGFGDERYEKLEMQERVQKLFSKFAEIDEETWTVDISK